MEEFFFRAACIAVVFIGGWFCAFAAAMMPVLVDWATKKLEGK